VKRTRITRWFLVGILLGPAAFGAALLYEPPLVRHPRVAPITSTGPAGERVESFVIEVPADGIAVTNSGALALAPFPAGIARFTEERISKGLAVLAKIRDAGGEVIGYASELEVFSETDFSKGDVTWDTQWTLVIPARGALFLHGREHAGELFPKVIAPTLESGQDWVGDWTVNTTVGPRGDGRGLVVGGTGEFAGARGWYAEIDRLTRFTPKGEMFVTVRLETALEPRP
jgi:hypothetical protein